MLNSLYAGYGIYMQCQTASSVDIPFFKMAPLILLILPSHSLLLKQCALNLSRMKVFDLGGKYYYYWKFSVT